MSHAATNWAIQQRGLKPIAKIVLWHLADCHNPVSGCFPTQQYLAEQAEISRASVNRYLDELETAGLIRREQVIDPTSKRQKPTRYRLAFEADFAPQDIVSRVSGMDTGAVSQESPSRVSKIDEAVSQSSETLTCKGTSKNPLEGEEFLDRLWQRFPRRLGAQRFEAMDALRQIDPSEWPILERAVLRQRELFDEDCRARGETADDRAPYAPLMAKWLAKGSWRVLGALSPSASEEIVVSAPGEPAYEAVAALRDRRPPVGKSGRASFLRSEVDRALALSQRVA